MVQTKSNSSSVEDPVSGQALGGDNKNAEGSSRGTISEALQGPAGSDAPPVSKGMQFSGSQEALKNPDAMDARDSMEVDAPPGNKKSGKEDEIAAKIEQLKKEQKKAQMRTKLRHLRENKAQRFVKDISEQESYMQKLALKKAKKVCDPDMYLEESQRTLDKYVSQVNLVFGTKPLMYASKKVKCFYAAAFLAGIPQRK